MENLPKSVEDRLEIGEKDILRDWKQMKDPHMSLEPFKLIQRAENCFDSSPSTLNQICYDFRIFMILNAGNSVS